MRSLRNRIVLGIVILLFTPSFHSQAQSSSKSILNNILNKVTQSSDVKAEDLTGKWNYQGSACNFESSNILNKMGGTVAASQVENQFDNYLSKIGVKEGVGVFSFNSDHTYTADLGKVNLSGDYTLNESSKEITLTYLKGMAKVNGTVEKSGNNLKLLFDADNLLKLLKTASSVTDNSTLKAITSITDTYDGVQLGFDLQKE